MKHWRSIGILGAILFALGGIATWDEWQTKKDKEEEKTKNKISSIKPEDIYEIEFQNFPANAGKKFDKTTLDEGDSTQSSETLTLKAAKKDGFWAINEPLNYPADQSSIESLIKTITDYSYTQEISNDREKWPDYGLEHPQRVITLKYQSEGPHSLSIFLGNKAPIGYNVYFRTSLNQKVLMGSQHLLVSTNKSLLDFRDKKIVSIDANTITNFGYHANGQAPIEVTHNKGVMAIISPEQAEADPAEVKDFIAELNNLKAQNIDEKPSDQLVGSFNDPLIAVTWRSENLTTDKIMFANHNGKFFASLAPNIRVFEIPAEMQQKLKKDLLFFRNRRIFASDLTDVKFADIDGKTYQNIDGSWYTPEEAKKALNKNSKQDSSKEEASVRALMVDLEFAKSDRFDQVIDSDLKKYFDQPALHRLKLTFTNESKSPLTIDFFDSSDKDKYWVRRSDKSVTYRIPRSALNSIDTPKSSTHEGLDPSADALDLPIDDSDETTLNIDLPAPKKPG